MRLVASLMAPIAWLAAAIFHVTLWTRHTSAPILYLAIYWLLSASASAAILYQHIATVSGVTSNHMQIYIQGFSMLLSALLSVVDCICFYDEVKSLWFSLHNVCLTSFSWIASWLIHCRTRPSCYSCNRSAYLLPYLEFNKIKFVPMGQYIR